MGALTTPAQSKDEKSAEDASVHQSTPMPMDPFLTEIADWLSSPEMA